MKKVFILGNPRSGTSLFRLMMNSHQSILAPPECGFMQWWHVKYQNWSIADSIQKNRLVEFISDLLSSKKIESWKIDRQSLLDYLLETKPTTYGQLVERVYLYWGGEKRMQAKVIADKNNYYINHLDEIDSIWPGATYILVVRDGRDVACSYRDMSTLDTDSPYKPKLPNRIDEIAKEWSENNGRVLNYFDKKGPESYLYIRFEDLINDSEGTLKRVSEFLDVAFDYSMLDYYLNNRNNQDEPLITLDWKLKTLEKPDVTAIGRYRERLNDEDIKAFNEIAYEMLCRFEYQI